MSWRIMGFVEGGGGEGLFLGFLFRTFGAHVIGWFQVLQVASGGQNQEVGPERWAAVPRP